jgi:hypothetical protein
MEKALANHSQQAPETGVKRNTRWRPNFGFEEFRPDAILSPTKVFPVRICWPYESMLQAISAAAAVWSISALHKVYSIRGE